jgi:Flp pilus assembly protein TadG
MLRFLSYLSERSRALRVAEDGNIAILFTASVIPLLLVMGGAVDLVRFARYKAELSNAIDAAALALARIGQDYTEEEATDFIEDYVTALAVTDDQFTVSGFDVDKTDNGYIVTADASMETIFLPLGKMAENGGPIMNMGMDIAAEVVHSSNRLEVALVLDVTGSMNCGETVSSSCTGNWSDPGSSSRIVALRDAATTLVNTLMTEDVTDADQIKIGVVPFEGTVNIGSTYAASPPSWVDWSNEGQAYWTGRNIDRMNFSTYATCTSGDSCSSSYSRVGHKWLFDQLSQDNPAITWAGCVEMRREPYDILDTTPTTSSPDTLFVPFFWPDEPDRYSSSSSSAPYQYTTSPDTRYNSNHSSSSWNATSTSSSYNYTYHNNYLRDKQAISYGSVRPSRAQSLVATKYRRVSSTNKAEWHSGQLTNASSFPYSAGPNRGCPQAIVPLTNTKATVTSRLSGLIDYPAMGTFIPNGLVWGWHLLSPNEPFTEGMAPGDEYYDETVKAIVLFTDGDNSVTGASNHNESYFNGYNYVSHGRLGSTDDAGDATDGLDDKTASLCTNVKADGIRLYTITFGTISSSSETLMRECATYDDGEYLYYHAPNTTDLEDIFNAIGEDLSEIHLAS